DFILHGPLYSYLEKFSRPQSMPTAKTNVTPTTNITAPPSKEDEFKAFIEKYPVLAKGFDYQNYRSALKYFEAMPELKGEEDLHEFLNAHIRQWDFLGLAFDDFGELRIRDLKYHIELDEKEKSLLPLRKSEMEKLFPKEDDREIINRSRALYPFLLEFNAKTGEDEYEGRSWTWEDKVRAITDNLTLMLDGSIYERIMKIFEEGKEDIAKFYFDYGEAKIMAETPPFSNVYRKPIYEFLENYLPVIKEDKRMNLGMRYTLAVAHRDVTEVLHKKREKRVDLYSLYAKALGYSGILIFTDCKKYGWAGDETIGVPASQDILRKLPKGGRYAPGMMLSIYTPGYASDGSPLILQAVLPNNEIIEF
ncbi:hypothetical protein, partial [Candidatus Methanodesulfokora washburnensis]